MNKIQYIIYIITLFEFCNTFPFEVGTSKYVNYKNENDLETGFRTYIDDYSLLL